jgi:N-acetylmuramic acid 6-phosphate etherase
VGEVLEAIAGAVERVESAFQNGGRLIYVGAGTSGRLGVLDAAECPPTFGTQPGMVIGLIAGGDEALRRAQEGAEDRPEDGARALRDLGASDGDVVMGIASSGVTPYVLGALEEAERRGAATVFFTCNPDSARRVSADVKIVPVVGPEVIAGSTRLKAGTATKMVLNMITTAAMVRMGKVYENLMVDLVPTCDKLRDRAERIILALTDLSPAAARACLAEAGDLKTALVMSKRAVSRDTARRLLAANGGAVGKALSDSGV